MKIHSIEISKYKPMLHGSIDYLKILFPAIIQIILGDNGKGKSSLLRELTPFPASRPDYEAGGYKRLEISHLNDNYIVESNFSSTSKAHSFKLNDVELNQSGATELQTELCRQHFGLSDVIDKVMSGSYKLCIMGKMERRSLFMSTYPSDLTFILDKHKNICSQIRVFNGNLKALKERQTELNSKLIDKDQLARSYELKQLLDQTNIYLDQEMYLIRNTQNDYLHNKDYDSASSYSIDNLLSLNEKLKLHYNRFCVYFQHHPEMFPNDNRSTTIKLMEADNTSLSNQIATIDKQAKALSEELNQFKQLVNNDIESEIKNIKKLIVNYKEQIDVITITPEVPIVSVEELSRIREAIAPRLLSDMDVIYSVAGKLWPEHAIDKAKEWLKDKSLMLSKYRHELEIASNELTRVKSQKEVILNQSYPSNCSLICKLKRNVDTQISELSEIENKWQAECSKLAPIILDLQRRIAKLELAMQAPCTALPIIRKLESLTTASDWGFFLIDRTDLIYFLNHKASQLSNNLAKLIHTNNSFYLKKKYKTELLLCESKLATLEATNLPTKQLIEKSIIEKEASLHLLIESYNSLQSRLYLNTNKLTLNNKIQVYVSEFDLLTAEFLKISQHLLIQRQLDFLQILLDNKVKLKVEINTKLRSIEQILKEQEGYLIRLNDEILPSMKDVEEKLKLWIAVEKEMSPASGIPHIYTIRYINSLIKLVNDYIKLVWSYDLEIVYLSEDEPLDFTLQVLINKSTELKDINICSDGQKAMVNLAFTLAIAMLRGYLQHYPWKLDEIDAALSSVHRENLLQLFKKLIDDEQISQMFMVNHYASLYSAFSNSDVVCLGTSGIVTPPIYNQHTTIK